MAMIADARLRERVNEAVAEFEVCLGAVVEEPSTDAMDRLRDATDRLMRAAARMLIDLGGQHGDLPN